MQDANIFISCVTKEFGAYRQPLRDALTRKNVHVKIQEDFTAYGDDTLAMLEDYLRHCNGVAHFIGATGGWTPPPICVENLLERDPALEPKLARLGLARADLDSLSATQWEAWLAIALKRQIVLLAPAAGPAPDASQARHIERLAALARHPVTFTDTNHLVAIVLKSAIFNVLVDAGRAVTPRRPNNLLFASLGDMFKGRAAFLDQLRTELTKGRNAVAVNALHGLGGIGKTRAAIEYAHRFAAHYSALLFIGAETPERLEANLAGLASAAVLDLPEQDAPQDNVKIPATLGWLASHPTWLLIFDNVDDEAASAAVGRYLPQLEGGHVVVTGRLTNYPAGVRKLELGVLGEDAAVAFLLERTEADRTPAPDDEARARELARELGGLALGLEQAGAYIEYERIGFADYLNQWRERREAVRDWFDPHLMSYARETGLAATWATSVARLKPDSRRLLDRLAFLAPELIPDFLLDVKAEGDDLDAKAALRGLYAYSLASRAVYDDGRVKHNGFAVHRLVQDYARRGMDEEWHGEALKEALTWVSERFSGGGDVRSWPRLDPLAPHALAVAQAADEAGIAEPTGVLLGNLGVLYSAKARRRDEETVKRRALAIGEKTLPPDSGELATRLNNLAVLLNATSRAAEAEPLFRRALKIGEASLGPDHPDVAIRLNNLAGLLRDTNRAAEAEPLFRRALKIDEASFGPDHPEVATDLNNLASLLHYTNRSAEAEPLYRRALKIGEATFGSDHPKVAIRLNNLATLLRDTNRAAETEPLFRRALSIFEASYGPDHPHTRIAQANIAALNKVSEGKNTPD